MTNFSHWNENFSFSLIESPLDFVFVLGLWYINILLGQEILTLAFL